MRPNSTKTLLAQCMDKHTHNRSTASNRDKLRAAIPRALFTIVGGAVLINPAFAQQPETSEELDALMESRPMPPRERVVIPTYADKRNEAREKRKGSIFQPRPREVPSGG